MDRTVGAGRYRQSIHDSSYFVPSEIAGGHGLKRKKSMILVFKKEKNVMAMSDIHGETSRKMLFPLFSRSINSNISTRTKKLIFIFFQIKKKGMDQTKQSRAEPVLEHQKCRGRRIAKRISP